jgi:hypothetical protein
MYYYMSTFKKIFCKKQMFLRMNSLVPQFRSQKSLFSTEKKMYTQQSEDNTLK